MKVVRSRIGLIPAKEVSLNGWEEREGRKKREREGREEKKEREGKEREGRKEKEKTKQESGEKEKNRGQNNCHVQFFPQLIFHSSYSQTHKFIFA